MRRESTTLTSLKALKLDLVSNVPDSMGTQGLTEGSQLRRAAIDRGMYLVTDIKLALLTALAPSPMT